jgi:5-methylcytosine-specific restriction endonuclease McrA
MSLRSLSDQQILSDIQALTRRERSITLQVLLHLNEIERRRLHLRLGHSSMFDYCTSGLGYSASAASRRIRTARCVARFPEVYELLGANEVNVSTVAQVSHILTPENKNEVLSRIRGKSQREVEAVIAHYEPLASIPRDRVRTVVVRVPVPATPAVSASLGDAAAVVPVANADTETRRLPNSAPDCRPAGGHDRNGCAPNAQDDRPASRTNLERRALVHFSASEVFMAKLERVRSLAWHQLPVTATLEQVFELALDLVIEREDPFKRFERRTGDAKRNKTPKPHSVETSQSKHADSRHVSLATKDNVYVRDKGRCTFVGTSGRRCESTRALQVDHVKPVAFGGAGMPTNLRLLCAYHNRLEAERLLVSAGRYNRPHADERPPTGR